MVASLGLSFKSNVHWNVFFQRVMNLCKHLFQGIAETGSLEIDIFFKDRGTEGYLAGIPRAHVF